MDVGRIILIIIVLSAAQSACTSKKQDNRAAPLPMLSKGAGAENGVVAYPHARWRLASFDELGRTTIWLRHIAIRHEGSDARWFRDIEWSPDPEPPKRTAAEALKVAHEVATLSKAAPNDFDGLARRYSEDVVTREMGGNLGGVRANQLQPEFLDVLAALKPGEVSSVFQTPYAFHILKRDFPPFNESVAGRRIVIAYEGTVAGAKGNVARSRGEAFERAAHVAKLAASGAFEDLVREYSDAPPAALPGDMGVFSRLDPEFFPQEVEVLASMRTDEVSKPLDSRFGYQILQRTRVGVRRTFAMEYIQLKFDPNLDPHEENSLKSVGDKARVIAHEVGKHPEVFDSFRSDLCCKKVWRWSEGRGPLVLTEALDGLRFDEVATRAVKHDWFLIIPKRLDPAGLPPEPSPRNDLPLPARPDYEAFIEFNSAEALGAVVHDFAKDADLNLPWTATEKASLSIILKQLSQMLEAQAAARAPARRVAFERARERLRGELDQARYEAFEAFANSWAVRKMLQ